MYNYDPFGESKYRYTVDKVFRECDGRIFEDRSLTIFLSTRGTNKDEIPEKLYHFLTFVRDNMPADTTSTGDPYTQKLLDTIQHVKSSREKENQFMVLEEMMRQEHKAGWEEGRKEGEQLGSIKTVCELVNKKILSMEQALEQAHMSEEEFRAMMKKLDV